ncbi:MAG: translesion error-prone DNA polymerase V autoproteolytic subunit [Gammaproteobacteria bacterium]|nr:translesion error-prone DNA polymerase V autoproteolytic subunit [Gammaproteobacteria bacterium]
MSLSVSLLGRADAVASSHSLPLYSTAVRAGFPSPADDHLDTELDLHRYVVKRPASTYFARAEGYSMIGDSIHPGALLVVDRSLEALPGRIVVICVDGEMTVKRLERVGQRTYLKASNPNFKPIPLDGRESQVWGVVTDVIHNLLRALP